MTSFLSASGGIGTSAVSKETSVLRDIDSSKQSFVNKDFVKNISWLNNSVDTLSAYTQKLQAGVDQANMNALEQLQSIFSDLFMLFAGLEPTGVDVGDLKYVLQGIGAMLGINPDTPFPLNIFDAVEHMFTNYMVPLEQFTDVIFDMISAWALDLGLSQEFVDSMNELKSAIEALGHSFSDLFGSLGELLTALGGSGWDLGPLGDLWDALMNMFGSVDTSALKPVIAALADLGIPFIDALTALINAGTALLNPLSSISAGQISTLGENAVVAQSDNTTQWNVASNSTAGWIYDATTDSFTTLGNGVAKRVLVQKALNCTPGDKLRIGSSLKWDSIPSGANGVGVQLAWFNGLTEISQTNVNIPSGHGSSGGFTAQNPTDITVPANVDNFKVGAYNDTSISSGQVWVKSISVQRYGTMNMSLIDGISQSFNNLLNKLSSISVGTLTDSAENLLPNPNFDGSNPLANDGGFWSVVEGVSALNTGNSVSATANGTLIELLSDPPIKAAENDKIDAEIWLKYTGATGTGDMFRLSLVFFDDALNVINTTTLQTLSGVSGASSNGTNNNYVKLSGSSIVAPAGTAYVSNKLSLLPGASAGVTYWSNGSLTKPQLMNPFFITGWQSFLDTLGGQLNSVWSDIETRLSGLNISGLFDVTKLLGTLTQGQVSGLPDLATLIGQIRDILAGLVVTPINSLVQDIADWFNSNLNKTKSLTSTGSLPSESVQSPFDPGTDIANDIKNILDGLWNGAFNSAESGKTPADTITAAGELRNQADLAMNQANYVTALLSGPRISPRWMSTGLHDDVSFPIVVGQSWYTPTLGKVVLIPITADSDRTDDNAYGAVRIALNGNAMTSIYIGIYRPDSSGVPQLEVNLGNVKSNLTLSNVQVFSIPNGYEAQKGEVTFLGVLQVGGTAGQMITTPALQNVLELVQTVPLYLTQGSGTSLTALPSTISSNVEYTPTWGGLGLEAGSSQWTDFLFNSSNWANQDFSYTIPSVTYLYCVGVGAGGAGGGGDGGAGYHGEGGRAGSWNGVRLRVGIDTPAAGSVLTVRVPCGGTNNNKETAGSPGGCATARANHEVSDVTSGKVNALILNSGGTQLFAADSGDGGRGSWYTGEFTPDARSPGNFAYGGRLFTGGAAISGGGSPGANGNNYGGGGQGGNGGSFGAGYKGGSGAPGFVSIKASNT